MTVLEIVLLVVVIVESAALITIAIIKLIQRSIERKNRQMQQELGLNLLRDDQRTLAKRVLEIEKHVKAIENELNDEDEEP